MPEMLNLLAAALEGFVLGALFYAGLWWTVHRGLAASRPALWFSASYLVRMGLILAGLYWVAGGNWQRLLVCLGGCLAARFAVAGVSRLESCRHLSQGAGHAD